MNKQELIKKLKDLLTTPSELEGLDFDDGYDFGIESAITLAEQLDEPKKPVVPQYVADFYESIKDDFEHGVYELCVNFYNCDLSGKIKHWFDCNDTNPIQVLVNMHQFGYEVEKEKVYTVEIPIANSPLGYHYVLRKTTSGEIIIDSFFTNNWGNYDYCQLTEAEIKKDHDWALKYAKEVK